jgi:hypothetical protein
MTVSRQTYLSLSLAGITPVGSNATHRYFVTPSCLVNASRLVVTNPFSCGNQ